MRRSVRYVRYTVHESMLMRSLLCFKVPSGCFLVRNDCSELYCLWTIFSLALLFRCMPLNAAAVGHAAISIGMGGTRRWEC